MAAKQNCGHVRSIPRWHLWLHNNFSFFWCGGGATIPSKRKRKALNRQFKKAAMDRVDLNRNVWPKREEEITFSLCFMNRNIMLKYNFFLLQQNAESLFSTAQKKIYRISWNVAHKKYFCWIPKKTEKEFFLLFRFRSFLGWWLLTSDNLIKMQMRRSRIFGIFGMTMILL